MFIRFQNPLPTFIFSVCACLFLSLVSLLAPSFAHAATQAYCTPAWQGTKWQLPISVGDDELIKPISNAGCVLAKTITDQATGSSAHIACSAANVDLSTSALENTFLKFSAAFFEDSKTSRPINLIAKRVEVYFRALYFYRWWSFVHTENLHQKDASFLKSWNQKYALTLDAKSSKKYIFQKDQFPVGVDHSLEEDGGLVLYFSIQSSVQAYKRAIAYSKTLDLKTRHFLSVGCELRENLAQSLFKQGIALQKQYPLAGLESQLFCGGVKLKSALPSDVSAPPKEFKALFDHIYQLEASSPDVVLDSIEGTDNKAAYDYSKHDSYNKYWTKVENSIQGLGLSKWPYADQVQNFILSPKVTQALNNTMQGCGLDPYEEHYIPLGEEWPPFGEVTKERLGETLYIMTQKYFAQNIASSLFKSTQIKTQDPKSLSLDAIKHTWITSLVKAFHTIYAYYRAGIHVPPNEMAQHFQHLILQEALKFFDTQKPQALAKLNTLIQTAPALVMALPSAANSQADGLKSVAQKWPERSRAIKGFFEADYIPNKLSAWMGVARNKIGDLSEPYKFHATSWLNLLQQNPADPAQAKEYWELVQAKLEQDRQKLPNPNSAACYLEPLPSGWSPRRWKEAPLSRWQASIELLWSRDCGLLHSLEHFISGAIKSASSGVLLNTNRHPEGLLNKGSFDNLIGLYRGQLVGEVFKQVPLLRSTYIDRKSSAWSFLPFVESQGTQLYELLAPLSWKSDQDTVAILSLVSESLEGLFRDTKLAFEESLEFEKIADYKNYFVHDGWFFEHLWQQAPFSAAGLYEHLQSGPFQFEAVSSGTSTYLVPGDIWQEHQRVREELVIGNGIEAEQRDFLRQGVMYGMLIPTLGAGALSWVSSKVGLTLLARGSYHLYKHSQSLNALWNPLFFAVALDYGARKVGYADKMQWLEPQFTDDNLKIMGFEEFAAQMEHNEQLQFDANVDQVIFAGFPFFGPAWRGGVVPAWRGLKRLLGRIKSNSNKPKISEAKKQNQIIKSQKRLYDIMNKEEYYDLQHFFKGTGQRVRLDFDYITFRLNSLKKSAVGKPHIQKGLQDTYNRMLTRVQNEWQIIEEKSLANNPEVQEAFAKMLFPETFKASKDMAVKKFFNLLTQSPQGGF